ncbi:hypothetical protein [Haloarchaeobius sp. DYHT-AS-18]|uniref:hypothetical protein n=1 Tax=Haloarchaeobius sp. DYHT-AS-18 TaxID=3446117 RepID=UPI003EB7E2C6
MSDAALQRTIRRGIALLLVPLCLRVIQFRNFHAENGVQWRLLPDVFTFWLPSFLLVGAVLYLVGSFFAVVVPERNETDTVAED